jgi:hypothetical protein
MPTSWPHIEETLVLAIAEAKTVLKESGAGPRFMELAQHAREMHDILLEAIASGGPNVSQRIRGMCTSLGNAVDELEAIATRRRV